MLSETLSDLCPTLHNWFNIHHDADIHSGTFTIVDGSIESLPFLIEGQYFRVVGSALNDGVYQYPAEDMTDETFTGAIWAMFVPLDVIRLAERIEEYNEQVAHLIAAQREKAGITSESFGGSSYTLSGSAPPGMEIIKAGIDADVRHYRKLVIF